MEAPRKYKRQHLEEAYPDAELLFMTGHDNAILGVAERCGQPPFVVYDLPQVKRNVIEGGMTHVEADEWIEYNITGAWVGGATPALVQTEFDYGR